ncbi:DUF6247 family protein [Nocardia sp. NPDC056000]|uniref:DUF6247 family protein n=1 Tax=Nocardia sp. NPDC056000 TaxID=3345674 RepID=UPI0035E25910
MASPTPDPHSGVLVPSGDPAQIRAALPAMAVPVFDREWALTLEEVKTSMDFEEVFVLLAHWRHIAAIEQRSPGAYARLQAKIEEITTTGVNSTAASPQKMQDLIARRRAPAVKE